MIRRIQEFFSRRLDNIRSAEAGVSEQALQIAASTLLFEVARSDLETHPDERKLVSGHLRKAFGLSEQEIKEVAEIAEQEAEDATSLFPFTRLINDRCTADEKVRLVEMLWRVAFADGELDPFEESQVRKIAELLYVSHSRFIQAKHRAVD